MALLRRHRCLLSLKLREQRRILEAERAHQLQIKSPRFPSCLLAFLDPGEAPRFFLGEVALVAWEGHGEGGWFEFEVRVAGIGIDP